MKEKKILALSSPGGHWVQLCRLLPVFSQNNMVYACTYSKPVELSEDDSYYIIGDINRDAIGKLLGVAYGIYKILRKERPTHVITTGALPGLIAIILARTFGVKTIWLDSIANSEKISLSGRVASYLTPNCFTQWESLSNPRIKYIGRII